MIQYRIQETAVQVIRDDGKVAIKNGVLIEGEQLCTIYNLDEESFSFVCAMIEDLAHILSSQGLSMQVGDYEEETEESVGVCDEKMLYVCNECHEMHEDETYICQVCDCESLRLVPESELIN